MNKIVRLSDLRDFTPISGAISDERIDPLIQYCELIELPAIIGEDLTRALLALDIESATDKATEKFAFYNSYVRPYASLFVFVELIQTHGFNVKNDGVVIFTDSGGGSAAVPDKQRGDLIQQFSKIKSSYFQRLINQFLVKLDQTLDSISYTIDHEVVKQRASDQVGIRASRNIKGRIQNETINKFRL